ncbi:hypothetical protein GCM10022222_34520 [Amycolatopsis ultiminotia]|uniref:NAD-dependent epimerase/dehydratase domain-containing protein n=1 Tax=Amycolatopsis ultiminotia TaxID=543629 RepID=A0ABP6WAN5_9PSEU
MTAGLETGDILVTGATGFTGTAVLRALVAGGAAPRVRVLARGPVPEWMRAAGVAVHHGDLTDPAALTGVCAGVTTLVHLASRIAGTDEECAAVNERGTAHLLAEARRAGTRRILHLSTCAIYRDGVHRAAPEPLLTTGRRTFGGPLTGARARPHNGTVCANRATGSSGTGPSGLAGAGSAGAPIGQVGRGGGAVAGEPGGRAGRARPGGDPQVGAGPVRSGRGGRRVVLETGPASGASRSRLAGERLVRSAGGIVLRPHLVYGAGDRHVIPALVHWLRAVPAWADGGTARSSVVAVAELASVIAAFALDQGTGRPGEVFHVADPRPVRMRTLAGVVCGLLDLPLPARDLPLAEHRMHTRAALPWLTDHQWSLLTRDHWYASDRVWAVTGVSPGPGLAVRLGQAAGWYREILGTKDRIRQP